MKNPVRFSATQGFLLIALLSCLSPIARADGSAAALPVIEETLVSAPNVPPAIHRNYPARVIVRLETREVVKEISDGVRYNFWTFNGSVPGPLMRVREGDTVELHLRNDPASHMSHNIDMHAVMGPGGGAAATVTPPGHESVFSFKAMRPGIFIYHCATPPVPMHIANGMYGLILVEPKQGLPKVDHEYYVVQGDFYTTEPYHTPGLSTFDMKKLLLEEPTYVLFNGRENSLTGANALTSKEGDKVRLFVGDAGPNLVSSFHIIGQIFDDVSVEGASLINHNVQTTLIPAGGATMIQLSTLVPGTYLLVDHSITRAFMQGALGQLVVTGAPNPTLYHKISSGPVSGEAKFAPAVPATISDPFVDGKRIFTQICSACHQADAMGLPGAFPPLAMSDFLNSDHQRAIGIVLHGLHGKITVNNTGYESVMPSFGNQLTDAEIAHVLTYVLNNFNNQGGIVTVENVKAIRNANAKTH